MNGGDLTVNPWNGFEYEFDGIKIEIPPITHDSERESFYRAVEYTLSALLETPNHDD